MSLDNYEHNKFSNVSIIQKITYLLFNIVILMTTKSIITYIVFIILLLFLLFVILPYNKTRFISVILLSLFAIISTLPLLIVINNGSDNLLTFYNLAITNESLYQATNVLLRSISMMLNIVFFISSTNINNLLLFFEKIKMPNFLITLMLLTYRLIFLIYEQAVIIKRAQDARLGNNNYINSFKNFALLNVNSFMKGSLKSNKLQIAMDARLFDTTIKQIQVDEKINYKYLMLQIFTIVGVIIINWSQIS